MTILFLFVLYASALSVGLARAGLRIQRITGAVSPKRRVSRVLIVGATGGTGRQLVTQALDRGYQVTALVRDPSALQIDHPMLRVMRGDVLDQSSVEEAVKGQDAVISALGHKRYFGPSRILSDGTRNLVRAMEASGVSRFICETSLGIGSSAGRMGIYYTFFVIPVILPFYFWDKTRQEQIIAQSKTEWVIVRPGVLTNAERKGTFRHGPQIGNFLWTVRIRRADVAEFMLNQLTDDTYLGTAVGVSGK
ncbi:MAG: SDR family oxidoreductase [Candidatus Zixiibacteriota bacterium]